ncbi:MAG: hypothetical protein HYU76_00330 [Betaproteobacteria bacterium]|nr:hypothetical protein [Betaproteobacteria bacterium]
MTGPLDNPKFPFDPVEELKKKAKQHSMYVIAGNVVASEVAGAHLLTLRLFGPEGTELACYVRQQPDTPPLNAYLYVSENFDYRTQMSPGAIAAGPERMEGKRSEPGVLITDLDMERLRYLRTRNVDEENLSIATGLPQCSLTCTGSFPWT